MATANETVRYWGETEEARQAAFQADAAVRAPLGWRPVSQSREMPFGKTGLDLVVTYQRDGAAPVAPPPVGPPPVTPTRAPPLGEWRTPPPAPPIAPPIVPPACASGSAAGWRYPPQPPAQVPGGGPGGPRTRSVFRRRLRILMVVGGMIGFFVDAILLPHYEGPPPPSAYFGLGIACQLSAVVSLGIGWYALDWRRLRFLRYGVAGTLVLLALILVLAGFDYWTGNVSPG